TRATVAARTDAGGCARGTRGRLPRRPDPAREKADGPGITGGRPSLMRDGTLDSGQTGRTGRRSHGPAGSATPGARGARPLRGPGLGERAGARDGDGAPQ